MRNEYLEIQLDDALTLARAEVARRQSAVDSITGRQRQLLARAAADRRDLTAAEADQADALIGSAERAVAALVEAERELREVMAEPVGRVSRPATVGQRRDPEHAPVFSRDAGAASSGIGRAAVMAAFGGRGNGGFADLGDFARAVARREPRLFANSSGMQTGVGADGGFAVPPAQLAALMAAAMEDEVVRPRALFVPMPTGTVTLPRFKDTDRSAGHAGLSGKVTAEGATADTQKATLERLTLAAKKLVVLVPSTNELLEDSGPTFASLLSQHMGTAMAAKVDDALLMGNGVDGALGIVNAPCTVSVAKETSQGAATLLPANLAKMAARLAPGSFGRAVWLCHSSVVAQLFVLTQTIKNVAGTENVGGFGPNWFTTAPDGTMQLLSRPVVITDRLPALGTTGDVVLADLSQYIVGQVGEARLSVDSSIGFKEDEIWFRLTLRLDGQPVYGAAITPRRGSDTLSPFVKLDTRA